VFKHTGALAPIRKVARYGTGQHGTLFRPGDRLDVRLAGVKGPSVQLTAKAVHSRSLPDSPGRFVAGFEFVAGRRTGAVPEDAIKQLTEAITHSYGR
jgi:hypothetical protein